MKCRNTDRVLLEYRRLSGDWGTRVHKLMIYLAGLLVCTKLEIGKMTSVGSNQVRVARSDRLLLQGACVEDLRVAIPRIQWNT